jgi:hypothetical protein
MQIKIDPEFRKHLLPLDTHEIVFLEESIAAEGCREALVIWDEQSTLIDGHNRYEICTRLGVPFETRSISLPNREAALDWMDKNQAGRRNMTTKDMEIVRGRIYNRRKKGDGQRGPEKLVQSEQAFPASTAEIVAAELEVSPSTVKRSGKRAEVYDAMLEIDDEEAARAARNATREEIDQASKKQPAEAAEELKAKAKEKAEPRTAPRKKADKPKEAEADEAAVTETQGVGVERAHQAIACLKRIPKGDALRKRAFQIVSDYIKQNR